MKPTRDFTREEFECHCCGENEMDQYFIDRLQMLRNEISRGMIINSGFRCELHNREVGGSARSSHLLGLAADVSIAHFSSISLSSFIERSFKYFTGIGISKSFIHLDCRNNSKPKLWIY